LSWTLAAMKSIPNPGSSLRGHLGQKPTFSHRSTRPSYSQTSVVARPRALTGSNLRQTPTADGPSGLPSHRRSQAKRGSAASAALLATRSRRAAVAWAHCRSRLAGPHASSAGRGQRGAAGSTIRSHCGREGRQTSRSAPQ
jgi:hypothetical protein